MLQDTKVIKIQKFADKRGSLFVIENLLDGHFQIKRIFYINFSGSDQYRGEHAHRETFQAFFGISGEIEIELSNGHLSQKFLLKANEDGIIIPPMIWIRLHSTKENSILLVLASTTFDEYDYIRDKDIYFQLIKGKR